MSDTPDSAKLAINYNAKAKLIYLVSEHQKDIVDGNDKMLVWDGSPLNTGENDENAKFPDDEPLEKFLLVHRQRINHGDLLTSPTLHHRASGFRFILYDESQEKFTVIINPDDSGSGYLTIPAAVLKNVTNAMEKYEEIFENEKFRYLNMHISSKDVFIKERLGDEVCSTDN